MASLPFMTWKPSCKQTIGFSEKMFIEWDCYSTLYHCDNSNNICFFQLKTKHDSQIYAVWRSLNLKFVWHGIVMSYFEKSKKVILRRFEIGHLVIGQSEIQIQQLLLIPVFVFCYVTNPVYADWRDVRNSEAELVVRFLVRDSESSSMLFYTEIKEKAVIKAMQYKDIV